MRNVSGGEPVSVLLLRSTLSKWAPNSEAANILLTVEIISVLSTLQSFCEASDKVICKMLFFFFFFVKCLLIVKNGARRTGVCLYGIVAFGQRFFPYHLCPG